MLLGALSLLLACLLALLFFKDYKTRSRMKLSENIPGPKALPLLGSILEIIFKIDSKLHICVSCHPP
jgi:AAA15 family ATPase/GTPase